MENLPQQINKSIERPLNFVQDFMKQAELAWREMEPRMKEHFKWNGAEHRIRPGNFSDFVKAETQANVRAAEVALRELREKRESGKEAVHREEEALKLIAFLRTEAQKIALYAEARDDDALHDLAEIMERRDTSLRTEYDKYLAEYRGSRSEEE